MNTKATGHHQQTKAHKAKKPWKTRTVKSCLFFNVYFLFKPIKTNKIKNNKTNKPTSPKISKRICKKKSQEKLNKNLPLTNQKIKTKK